MTLKNTPEGLSIAECLLPDNYHSTGVYNYMGKNITVVLVSKANNQCNLMNYKSYIDIFGNTNTSSLDLYDILKVIAVTRQPELMKEQI